jgi:hypothetical protein
MIVTKRLLGLERSLATSFPLGSAPSSNDLTFIVEREKKAVSVAERKAEEIINRIKRKINRINIFC